MDEDKAYSVTEDVRWALETIKITLEENLPIENQYGICKKSPFENSSERYKDDRVEILAHSWNEDDQPYNFKWNDFEVKWYKWFRRDMVMNKEINKNELEKMIRECTKSIEENGQK